MDFKKFFNESPKVEKKNFFSEGSEKNKKPESSQKPDRKVELRTTADSIDSTTADSPAAETAGEITTSHVCQSCQDSEWWIDIHLGGPHCANCKPPPAPGMVKESFFYDDHGNQWEIKSGRKSETWRKV